MAATDRRTASARKHEPEERVAITRKSVVQMCSLFAAVVAAVVGLQSLWLVPLIKDTARDEVRKLWEEKLPLIEAEARDEIDKKATNLVTRREFDMLRLEEQRRHDQIMKALDTLKRK